MTSGISFTVNNLDIDQTATTELDEIATLPSAYAYLLNTTAYPRGTAGVDAAFPQVAYEANFLALTVPSGTTVSDLVFTHPTSSTDSTLVQFSTSVGFATTLQDVDGNTIYLFLDSNPTSNGNVLIGRTSNSATAPAAFALVLDEAANDQSAGAYIVLYEAMEHLVTTDPNDVLNLANQLFVSAASTVTTTSSFSDFSDVPSGNTDYAIIGPDGPATGTNLLVTGQAPKGNVNGPVDDSTINVSTQGLGSGSQAVGKNATLQVDFVNGGAANTTGGENQIAYTSHVENVTEAQFSLTQVNPTGELINLVVSGWDSDDANVQGAAFRDASAANANITQVQVFDAAGNLIEDSDGTPNATGTNAVTASINAAGDAVLTNLQLDYTGKVFSTGMDQIRITNNDNNNNASFDVGEIQFSSTTTTIGSANEEVGTEVRIFDDGPSIDQAIAGGTAAFTTGATVTDTFTSDTGSDGGAGVVISQFQQTVGAFTGTLSAGGKSVLYEDAAGTDFFRLVVTDNGYNFEVLQSQLNTTRTLDFGAIAAGGPLETIDVPTADGVDVVRFDGLIFTTNNPLDAANNPGTSNTNDDANPDALGFGIKKGQASQMNDNEGFVADLIQPADGEFSQFSFDIQGIGNVKSVGITYWTLDGTTLSGPTTTTVDLLPGNNTTTFTIGDQVGEIPGDGTADQIYVKFDLANANQGVRVLNFQESQALTFPAVTLPFTLSNTDADGDKVTSNQYSIVVDPAIA